MIDAKPNEILSAIKELTAQQNTDKKLANTRTDTAAKGHMQEGYINLYCCYLAGSSSSLLSLYS